MARPRKENRETVRAERVSLALTPAQYHGLVSIAAMMGTTLNDFIGGLISQVVNANRTIIDEFEVDRQRHVDRLNLDVQAFAEDDTHTDDA